MRPSLKVNQWRCSTAFKLICACDFPVILVANFDFNFRCQRFTVISLLTRFHCLSREKRSEKKISVHWIRQFSNFVVKIPIRMKQSEPIILAVLLCGCCVAVETLSVRTCRPGDQALRNDRSLFSWTHSSSGVLHVRYL